MGIKIDSIENANVIDKNYGVVTMNVSASDNLSDLLEAIQNNGKPDPKKLASLKRELIALSKAKNTPMTVQMKMKPLITELEAVQDDDPERSGGKLWDALKPYIGDAQNLSATFGMLGGGGGLLLGILRKIFLPA